MCKLHEIHILVSISVWLEHSHAHAFACCLSLLNPYEGSN